MDALRRWCSQPWLYVVYAIGVFNICLLVALGDSLLTEQQIALLLSSFIAAHVFEENSCPGGFFFMNNLLFGSKQPLVYPQNSLTNMWTNLGAVIVFGCFAIAAPVIPHQIATVAVFFGVVETIMHTRDGILMQRKIGSNAKRTIYAPGLTTSVLLLLPLAAFAVAFMASDGFTWGEALAGVGISLGFAVCFILVPFAFSIKTKSKRFSFEETDTGYFRAYFF